MKYKRDVLFGLCGNEYTASIVEVGFADNYIKILHKSNSNNKKNRLLSILNLLKVVLLRFLCLGQNSKFKMCVPHCSNRYKIYIKILNPDEIYIIDDGITFLYWSEFHENNIYPLLLDKRLIGLVGADYPRWEFNGFSIDFKYVPRTEIVKNMLSRFSESHIRSAWGESYKSKLFVIIDDGYQSKSTFENLINNICVTYCAQTIIILHPSRIVDLSLDCSIKLNCPIECFVEKNKSLVVGVVGFGSTALLNIASGKPEFPVISKSVDINDLNESMRKYGVIVG